MTVNKNEALGAAINYAASGLPDGWQIEITVEYGAGWAELTDPEGNRIGKEQQEAGDLDLHESIAELVGMARAAHLDTEDVS